jgi:hypothetical protein
LVHDPLFEGNNGVIGDVNFFRADFRAALGDIAESQAHLISQKLHPRFAVKRMHLQSRYSDKETRPGKILEFIVIA